MINSMLLIPVAQKQQGITEMTYHALGRQAPAWGETSQQAQLQTQIATIAFSFTDENS